MAADQPPGGEQTPGGGDPAPDYKVYRSRRGLGGGADLSKLRGRLKRTPSDGGKGEQTPPPAPGATPPAPRKPRRWLLWIALGIFGWIIVSMISFAVSAQIQKGKLAGDVGDKLSGNPFLSVIPQNILVLGTDVRAPEFASDDEAAAKGCYEAAAAGKAPPADCEPYRADTIMVVRAGGTTFRRLSISRDTLAAIPGHDNQKINAAYAFGGAALTIRTVEDFLGIEIDHVAIVDFRGFREFIDALGGIEVDLSEPVCAEVSGGAANGGITLDLPEGESDLDGLEALALARTRVSDCDGDGNADAPLPDLFRAELQQAVISGIKGRLTDPLRLPINFIKGPLIAWNAPKALVSNMGALTMPQLMVPVLLGGGSAAEILKPTGSDSAGNLIVPVEECVAKVTELIGEEPPETPICSPG